MHSKHLPSFEFDFAPGVSTPRGRATRRWRMHGSDAEHARHLYYRFDDRSLVRASGTRLAAPLADALDIALAVHIADRSAPRATMGSHWGPRHLTIQIPVRQEALRSATEHQDALEGFLTYLTHDDWAIEFTVRDAPARRAEQEQPMFSARNRDCPAVVLHSGGLDSCLGIIEAAHDHAGGSVLAASVVSQNRSSRVQRRVLSALRPALPAEIVWAPVIVGLSGAKRAEQESSQRTRGFLYLTVGMVAAALSGGSRLQVCENGIGAINLPSSPDQLGTMNARGMHPVTLDRASSLISDLTGRALSVVNTGLWKTKAQLCRTWLTNGELIAAASQTTSCERTAWLGAGQSCGSCTSCLLRDVSLHAAELLHGDHVRFRRPDFDPLSSRTDWTEHDQLPIFALRAQADVLQRAVENSRALVQAFPDLARLWQSGPYLGLPRAMIEEQTLQLLQTYEREWGLYSSNVQWPLSADALVLARISPTIMPAVAS